MLKFEFPWVLAVLPLAFGYLWWVWRRSYVKLPSWQMRASAVLRALIITVLTLIVARPILVLSNRAPPVIALVDVSESVREDVLAREQSLLAAAWSERHDRPFEVVTFGAHARWQSTAKDTLKLVRHDPDGTDLAEAIRFASGLGDKGVPRLVLFSDGNETRGDARRAAAEVARLGVEINVVQLAMPPVLDARVTGLRFPSLMRRGQPSRLGVLLGSTQAGAGRIEVREDGMLVDQREIKVVAGSQSIDIDLVPSSSGFVRYEASVLMSGDSVKGNDRYEQVTSVAGEPRVLLCASTGDEGSHLEEAFRANGIEVDTISAQLFPSTIEGLSSYEAIVLAGVALSDLDRLRQSALTAYVRDLGGGLLSVIGPSGLKRNPAGEQESAENLLPIESATQSERQIPPVALVLLIDRSGSMVGEKLNYAKQAALAVVDKLSENAQVGVVTFDANFEWTLPLQTVTDKKSIAEKIGSLGAGGGTRFYPALEEAYYALGSAEAAARHLILLTDGNSTDPTELPVWLQQIREKRITVSTVAIGRQVDEKLLREIARVGQGRFHMAASASEVPTIFLEETKNIEREASQNKDTSVRQVVPARELNGIDFTTAPPLKGYFRAKAKLPTAEVLLETQTHDPILVRWRFGLGTVAAFTSDATARWATSWLTWVGFGKLWTQLLRGTQKTQVRREVSLTLKIDKDTLKLFAKATDPNGNFMNDLDVRAVVLDGAQQRHEIALPQVGLGSYAGQMPCPPGSLLAKPLASRSGRPLEGGWIVLPRPYSPELMHVGNNEPLLADLARIGGGSVVRLPETPSAGWLQATPGKGERSLPRPVPLALQLGLFALVLLILDVTMKRGRFGARR